MSGHRNNQKRKRGERARFEIVREGLIVQEDPWVLILAIEPNFYLMHRLHCALDVRVARKHDKRRVLTRTHWRSCGGCAIIDPAFPIFKVIVIRYGYCFGLGLVGRQGGGERIISVGYQEEEYH